MEIPFQKLENSRSSNSPKSSPTSLHDSFLSPSKKDEVKIKEDLKMVGARRDRSKEFRRDDEICMSGFGFMDACTRVITELAVGS